MAFLNWQVIFHLPYIGNCLRYHDYLLRKVFDIIQIFMSASRFLFDCCLVVVDDSENSLSAILAIADQTVVDRIGDV